MLQSDYSRITKDSDVLETADLSDAIREQLERLAGRGSPLYHRHRMYLDLVSQFLPFLPEEPHWVPVSGLDGRLTHLQVEALGITDVVVSKLYRFIANDRE